MKSDVNTINAEQADNIPTLADLALKYGTISQDQHAYLIQLYTSKNGQVGFEDLLRDEGMATAYQLELLKLIQEYLIVRKSGEEFGKIAIEKGLATAVDIHHALNLQKKEFRKSRNKKLIGDILVENRIITSKQKELILKEQKLFNEHAQDSLREESRPMENDEEGRGVEGDQKIEVIVSSDFMTAWIAEPNRNKLKHTLNQVKDATMRFGIVNGIYPDSFIKCFLDAGVKKFPIARVDCSHLLNRHNNLVFHIQDDTGKPVEKKKGDVLITQTESAIDICVENLYGENINTVAENDFSVRCGANTRWSRDRSRIMAAKSGFPALSADRKVFIHPVVYVLEDADYRHGPIEPYANLSVSGVITGAYPVTAGNLSSEEIRDARIDAIGDIRARVGITDTIIRAQGDVYASYVHNSRIETFGNVYVQNEIIDSQIRCSGKLESPTCRVISSKIYAKGGVTISGVGSERAAPSTIVAGGEQHVVGLVQAIMDVMNSILDKIEELKDEKLYQQEQADKIFKKMIKLKTFHDRAQKKRDILLSEFDKKKGEINKTILMNIQKLIATYDKRMNNALVTLKTMNASKKEHDTSVEELKKKIFIFTSQAENEILSHEKTLFAYLEKAKEMIGVPIIEIKGIACAGTTLGGVYQILSLTDDKNGFKIEEMSPQGGSPELQFLKLGQ